MSPEKKPTNLRVKLDGEMAKRFNDLKRKLGFENNTDLVRLLISRAYEEEFGLPRPA